MFSDNALNRSLVKRFYRSAEFGALSVFFRVHMFPFVNLMKSTITKSVLLDKLTSPAQTQNTEPVDDSIWNAEKLPAIKLFMNYTGFSDINPLNSNEQIVSGPASVNLITISTKQPLSPSVLSAVQSVFAGDFVPFHPSQRKEKHRSAAKHFHCQVALAANLADFILYEILFLAFAFNSLKENLSFNCFTEQRRKALL